MHLYNIIGVFIDVLNLIFQEKPGGEVFTEKPARKVSADRQGSATGDTKMKPREKIVSKCLQFLKFLTRYVSASLYRLHVFSSTPLSSYVFVLCRKNKTVQKHLHDHMDDLLKLDVAIPDMAEVLTEVCEYIQYKLSCTTLHMAIATYVYNS